MNLLILAGKNYKKVKNETLRLLRKVWTDILKLQLKYKNRKLVSFLSQKIVLEISETAHYE